MIWRTVQGFPVYEVSERGDVRRAIPAFRQPVTGKHLKQVVDPATGYRKVSLWRAGEQRTAAVHRLVCEAFHGVISGLDVRHLDGDKSNNEAENLCWGTRSENNLDAVRHGTNANTAKVQCPLGHVLESPNICAGVGRRCRACSLSRAARQRANQRGESFDFEAFAEVSYRRVMSGQVKNYKPRKKVA